MGNLLYLTKLFKHPGFEEESEWRLITVPQRLDLKTTNGKKLLNSKYRINNEKIIPYLELDFNNKEDIIRSITFGGKNPNKQSIVKDFLKSRGFNSSRVIFLDSTIPYR